MNKSKEVSRRSFLQSVVGVFALSSVSFMALVSSGCSPDTGGNAGDSDSDAEQTMDSDAGDQSGRSSPSDSDLVEESSSDSDASDQSGRSTISESEPSDPEPGNDSDQSDQSGRSRSDTDQVTTAPSVSGEGVDSDDSGRR